MHSALLVLVPVLSVLTASPQSSLSLSLHQKRTPNCSSFLQTRSSLSWTSQSQTTTPIDNGHTHAHTVLKKKKRKGTKKTEGEPWVKTRRKKKWALIIDAENVSGTKAYVLCRQALQLGDVVVRRAYGHWALPLGLARDYRRLVKKFGVECRHQFHFSSGKGSSDMLMMTDAPTILKTHPEVDGFIIGSSDADFLPLVETLQKEGKEVVVFVSRGEGHPILASHANTTLVYQPTVDEQTWSSEEQEEKRRRGMGVRPSEYLDFFADKGSVKSQVRKLHQLDQKWQKEYARQWLTRYDPDKVASKDLKAPDWDDSLKDLGPGALPAPNPLVEGLAEALRPFSDDEKDTRWGPPVGLHDSKG
uniref:NYN domain-containing protein n=1 Tax=Chromera velia CCMP2878 TaxID=1169474 RepID=A0A0G4GCS8_9ALVE|eukprot:Cvel_21199.t1-p1 / transcript=Cvel_21199.t1 / gene=Cvel_21199 / organism=Chromera_velia_CCMP2878 / gene_product=hypothetical protein / transcript_product=hypothetical protein / location=Cvel_scaffold1968:2999-6781(-) / protein_length=359 / sequence_SO=supercontig / SO=protein_coding / is_pseudo=false